MHILSSDMKRTKKLDEGKAAEMSRTSAHWLALEYRVGAAANVDKPRPEKLSH